MVSAASTGSMPTTQVDILLKTPGYISTLIAVLCLNKMADILGYTEDPAHWNETVKYSNLEHRLESAWEVDTPGMFGDTGNGIGFSNLAPAANSMFPRDWVVTMAHEWMDDSVRFIFQRTTNSSDLLFR